MVVTATGGELSTPKQWGWLKTRAEFEQKEVGGSRSQARVCKYFLPVRQIP